MAPYPLPGDFPSPFTLPKDFLSGPASNLKKSDIDFKKTDLPEYDGLYATVLDNVLTKEECALLVKAAEARTNGEWEAAMINVGNGKQRLMTDQRDCGRIIWDDKEVVSKIWARIKDHVPEIDSLFEMPKVTGHGPYRWEETWQVSRLNERMRFLKYGKGQYFRPHMDGCFATEGNEEISFYTLHLYLNESEPDSEDGKLEGGATTFHSGGLTRQVDVDPKIGRVLLFQHKGLMHSGADVTSGIKMTLRTDLMYKKISGKKRTLP